MLFYYFFVFFKDFFLVLLFLVFNNIFFNNFLMLFLLLKLVFPSSLPNFPVPFFIFSFYYRAFKESSLILLMLFFYILGFNFLFKVYYIVFLFTVFPTNFFHQVLQQLSQVKYKDCKLRYIVT